MAWVLAPADNCDWRPRVIPGVHVRGRMADAHVVVSLLNGDMEADARVDLGHHVDDRLV